MESPANHFLLLRTGQAVEVHRVTRDTDGQTWILIWIIHGIAQHLKVKDVDV